MTSTTTADPSDFRCFCDYPTVDVAHATSGPLAGMDFAVKDLFDVAGYPTGCGHPNWPGLDAPSLATAAVVTTLLEAGAAFGGKAVTDEIAYSLNGRNAHYGTPVNPAAPDRVPGGSSSGPAVATAAGLVDFAIGTDTGGSVRVPASYCGLFGIRPTHGRLALDGCMPLAPSYDTVGWFARTGALLEAVGDVLLANDPHPPAPHCLVLTTTLDLVEARTRATIAAALRRVTRHFRRVFSVPDILLVEEDWSLTFRISQGAEIWTAMGPWVEDRKPEFGPGVRERMQWARSLLPDDVAFHRERRETIRSQLRARIGPDTVFVLPTTPAAAPLLTTRDEDLEDFRNKLIALTCVAGIGGLPQVTMPLGTAPNGAPVGLSLIGAPGADRTLLALAAAIDAERQAESRH
ncbi:amidase [Amorphus sp. MBR-141]